MMTPYCLHLPQRQVVKKTQTNYLLYEQTKNHEGRDIETTIERWEVVLIKYKEHRLALVRSENRRSSTQVTTAKQHGTQIYILSSLL